MEAVSWQGPRVIAFKLNFRSGARFPSRPDQGRRNPQQQTVAVWENSDQEVRLARQGERNPPKPGSRHRSGDGQATRQPGPRP